jgi:2-C-methyl-D-erythritol 4-phosphate cytidylyltransferase
MKDTVYLSEDGHRISQLLDRSKVWAGQSPEVFRFGRYLDACRRLTHNEIMLINGSSEPAVMAGMNIVMIPGDENNYKVTTNADLDRFKRSVHYHT